jgi:hypothetical protein
MKMVESLEDSLNILKKENSLIKELFYSNATAYDDLKKVLTIPIDIYLDSDQPDEIFKVYEAVLKYASSIGFDESIEFEAERGSWYKRLLAISHEKLTSEEV